MSDTPLKFKVYARKAASARLAFDGVDLAKPFEHLAFPLGDPGSNDSRLWDNTESDLDALEADLKTRAQACPVLYNHDDKGPAAGWVTGWRRAAEGLYVTMQLTPRAAQAVRDGEYLYISPHTFGTEDAAGRWHPSSALEISLVHTPAQKLGPLQAANATGGTTMDELLAQLRSALGLPPEASAEETITAALAFVASAAAATEEAAKAKAAEPAAVTPPAVVAPPATAAANAQLLKLVADVEAIRVEPLFAEAFREARAAGKNVPPDMEKLLRAAGLQTATAMLATLPAGQTPAEGTVQGKRAASGELPKTSSDHLRGHLHAYKPERAAAYEAAIEYQKKAAANGQQIDFRTAHLAVTRRAA